LIQTVTEPSNDSPNRPDAGDVKPGHGGALIEHPNQLPSTAHHHPHMFGMPEERPNRLREYWDIILRRRWTVLTCFAIVLVAVMTATFLMTKIYRATLTLQIDQQETKVMAVGGVSPNDTAYYDSQYFYQTQYELLRSDALAQRVIEQLNLVAPSQTAKKSKSWLDIFKKDSETEDDATPEEAETGLMAGLPGALTVAPVRNSQLVRVHFDSADPQMAARIANEIAVAFIKLNLERRMEATSYARTFLQERLAQIKVKLEDSEKELNAYTRKEGIVKPVEKQQSPDSQVLGEFTSALAKAQGERIRAEATYRQAKAGDPTALNAAVDSKLLQEYKSRQAKLEVDYQEGLVNLKPGHRKMQEIESQINMLKAKIDQETKAALGGLKASYDAALAQELQLAAMLKQSKETVLVGQDRSFRYNLLTREVDTNRQLYDSLLQRYKEIGVAGGVGINNITVVDKAKVPKFPIKPNLMLNLMIAIALGLGAGIGLALLLEHLDDTIKLPEDMEKLLGLPVLGVIPATRVADGVELAIAENADPRSPFAEAHRSLRTTLQFSTAEGMPKVLLVTSTSVGEGKSTTALSLATHITQTGKKVLLIDCDLRKASLHKKLGIGNDSGLTNYLAGDAQPVKITRRCAIPNLFLIPSGPLPPNPAELLGSAKMVALLNLAAERFDQVIIDGPPVLGLADAPLLGSLVEAAILVAECGVTSRQYAQGAVKRLRSTRTRLVGGVLTKVDTRNRSYGYHGYYYQYGDTDAKRLPA
jgi:capsular exopolysaccharide synthesis family protein